jgi:hypothetical protein
MLVYVSTKDGFYSDVTGNRIEQVVHDAFRNRLGHSTSRSEISAWSNSMLYMNNVLHNSSVPGDTAIIPINCTIDVSANYSKSASTNMMAIASTSLSVEVQIVRQR